MTRIADAANVLRVTTTDMMAAPMVIVKANVPIPVSSGPDLSAVTKAAPKDRRADIAISTRNLIARQRESEYSSAVSVIVEVADPPCYLQQSFCSQTNEHTPNKHVGTEKDQLSQESVDT